jgi:protein tyrosine phosphatase (PTP) superfamily phosphohydrolase (DUF442 family)
MSIEEIYNFIPVNSSLSTAGQPTEEQLRDIAAAGYEVVINLDVPDSRYALPVERPLLESLGVRYYNIPVDFRGPTLADFQRFAGLMEENQEKKLLVHCAANYRVSTFISLYGQTKWGWTVEAADAHRRRHWDPNEVWADFVAGVRRELGLEHGEE